ncbi:MAG: hypothetical protein KME40_32085 [Komarekiella atlantica HA4396-MV6]|jgi:hypothetical protein|nr:hypothetical protein [Komarekiella atlantica HA4396-MV6]
MTETIPYLDPNEFYRQEMDSWEELWDNSLSLSQNVSNILNQAVLLPQRDLMLPILATYILIPSKWARILPILFSWGGKGSGKSTTAVFAAKLHGLNQTFSATDTFSAIRNALDSMRWIDPQDKQFEKEGVLLPWDNIHIGTLKRDERIYQLLLFGYSRSSDKISIASPDGTNKEFFVFSPKIISSVDDIHLFPDFEELHRRLLVIPHKSFDDFTPEEKLPYQNFDVHTDKIDLDAVYWDGIEDKFFEFWNNPENGKLYAKYRTTLTRKGKKAFEHSMKTSQWIISIDLIVTGLVTGTWRNIPEAIRHLEKYWKFADKYIFGLTSATIQHLRDFIHEETGNQKKVNDELIRLGREPIELIISPQKLKSRIKYHNDRGELDIPPMPRDIVSIMSKLGWRLTSKGWMEKK